MKYLIFSFLLFTGSALQLSASCIGTDLRASLSFAEKAELSQRLADIPNATGNLWKATRNDQTIFLIGTIHVHDPRLKDVATAVDPLIEGADLLLVELTREDEAALNAAIAERPELLFLTSGPTLPDLMSEPDWQNLMQAANARGIPSFFAAKFQPWYLSVMLSMPVCSFKDMQKGKRGLDHLLMERATILGVPQKSLEPFDTLFALMGQDPLETQIEQLTLGLLPDDVATDGMVTMMNGYFDESAAELMELSRLIARRHIEMNPTEFDTLFDRFLTTLLDTRNKAWMSELLSTPEQQIVLAAGAAHLPGKNGLISLLRREGFTVTRLPF